MPLKRIEEPGFTHGFERDTVSWMLPPATLWDAQNYLFDRPGVARMRSGSTNLVTGAQTAYCTSIGICRSDDSTSQVEELYGANGKDGKVYSISKTTGAATLIGTPFAANSTIGRPCNHFGFAVFPGGFARSGIVCGQTNAVTFTSAGTTVITANNPQIALGGPDTTADVRVGMYVHAVTAATAYAGRIVSIDSGSLFSVWPVPTISLSPTAGAVTGTPAFGAGNTNGGVCTTSFQNRLLFGNSFDMAANKATSAITQNDRYVNYGVLPTETGINVTQIYSGASGFLFAPSWPVFNFFPVPGSDPIKAMEPVDDNQLLIFTSTHPVLYRGNLVTQTDESQSVTGEPIEVPGNAGCLSDLSVQRTRYGVMWAGPGGIYAWNGSKPIDLTDKKINSFWRAKVRGSGFAVHGAAYVAGHYILSYASGGTTEALAVNLSNLTWTRLTGTGTDNFLGVPRPTNPSQVFVARYWDQTGAAPSMTNGQVVRAETMFDPFVTGTTTTDADNQTIVTGATTRTLTGDNPETQKMFQRGTARCQISSTLPLTSLKGNTRLDASDSDASSTITLATLSCTFQQAITGATTASPIEVTTSGNHGYATDNYVDINGVVGNSAANGHWRITKTANTKFTLNGSTGNAAYVSGGVAKKLTETDFAMASLNQGQGVSFQIASPGADYIELQGFTVLMLEKPLVGSS